MEAIIGIDKTWERDRMRCYLFFRQEWNFCAASDDVGPLAL